MKLCSVILLQNHQLLCTFQGLKLTSGVPLFGVCAAFIPGKVSVQTSKCSN